MCLIYKKTRIHLQLCCFFHPSQKLPEICCDLIHAAHTPVVCKVAKICHSTACITKVKITCTEAGVSRQHIIIIIIKMTMFHG